MKEIITCFYLYVFFPAAVCPSWSSPSCPPADVCESFSSINHLLIIAALPAHNEKVKRPNIAPVVLYETMITHLHLKLFQTLLSGFEMHSWSPVCTADRVNVCSFN